MPSNDRGLPVLRYLGFAILAATVGLPLLGLAVLLTWGALLIPLVGLLMLAPLVAAGYVLRGRPPGRGQHPR